MADNLKLYFMLIGMRIKCQLEYRMSFVFEVLGTLFSSGIDLVVLLVLFGHTDTLGGWTLPQVAMLYGICTLSFALSELLFGGFDFFSGSVRSGQFDIVLMRPIPSFLQVLASEFLLRRLARALLGIVMLSWSMATLGSDLSSLKYCLIATTIVNGAMVFGSLLVAQAACCFWTIENIEAFNILTYGGNEMLSHPMDIYADWMKRFFTFVIPIAFINYVPVSHILGIPNALDLPVWSAWLSPAVGPVLLALSIRAWRFGVDHYQSTGS